MKPTKILAIVVLALGLMVWTAEVSEAAPMGTAFTYQGRLIDAGSPADGEYDFQFKLYDSNDPCTGTQLGSAIDVNDLDVIDGHFVVELDFGSGIFDGNARWLETRVVESPLGSNPCTLSPLLELTPTPYALAVRVPLALQGAIEGGSLITADNSISGITSGFEAAHTNDALSSWQHLSFGVKGSAVNTTTADPDDPDHLMYGGYFTAEASPGGCAIEAGPCRNAYGVYGEASGGDRNYGGYFRAAPGVYGSAYGVYGEASGDYTYGVYGKGDKGGVYGTGSTGVYGRSTVGYGHGVYGEATNSGTSTNYGGYFSARGEYGRGVYGFATGANGIGVYGQNSSPTGYGGFFVGDVKITGSGKGLIFPDGSKQTTAGAGGGSGWIVSGNNVYSGVSGNVGIGTTNPLAKLHVHPGSGSANLMLGFSSLTDNYDGILHIRSSGTTVSFDDNVGIGTTDPCTAKLAVMGGNVGIGTTSPRAKLDVTGSYRFASIRGENSAGGGYGVFGVASGDGGKGVWGWASKTGDVGNIGGYFMAQGSSGRGVFGWATATSWAQNYGGYFVAEGRSGYGGYFVANGKEGRGIYAKGGPEGYAAEFDGNVSIKGNVSIGWGGRVITPVLEITGGSDLSEQFEVRGIEAHVLPSAGMVVSIDPESPGDLVVSNKAYNRTVAGIISGAGGVKPGMLMGQKGTTADGEHPVALTGRVYCWADASDNPIEPGDLLTTSDRAGHAMKVTDYTRAQGAIIGKAMSSLESGRGLVLVLVTLQ